MSKVIVITGSTRGIGLGLAGGFLAEGCSVVISGRNPAALEQAARQLESRFGTERLASCACDVTRPEDVQKLWDSAVAKFGRVDIWINNAGLAHPQIKLWEVDQATINNIFGANVFGLLNGVRVAVKGMLAQGFGHIFNFEGFGSNGRVRPGIGIYGSSKAAVSFINKTLAAELEGTQVRVSSLQPGMVKTDMVLGQFDPHSDEWARFKPIFNIIASRVEDVVPFLVKQMLSRPKNGAHIEYLSRFGLMLRFLTAPFIKRDLFKED